MKNKTIEVVDELPEDIDTQMGNDLVAYEASQGIVCDFKRFSLMIKNVVLQQNL